MRVLLIRFSAMGDVCLSLPLVVKLKQEHPELEVHVLSRLKFAPIFENQKNIQFHGLYLEKDYKGLAGLYKLYKYVKNIEADIIIDLHDVLRTKIIRTALIWGKCQVFSIVKNRKERSDLIKGIRSESLKPAQELYLEAIQKAGFLLKTSLPISVQNYFNRNKPAIAVGEKIRIGIAPFAAHEPKMWPLGNYKAVFEYFEKTHPDVTFMVFGGGKSEKKQVDELFGGFANVSNTISKYTLKEELHLLPNLRFMLAMDSANMHLAYLSGIPVISIWGATHSLAGFALPDNSNYPRIEIPKVDLTCRPCSIYGNVPCRRGDHACMKNIAAKVVIEELERFME